MNLITGLRSALVQDRINERCSNILAIEVVISSIVSALWVWYFTSWQGFLWGVILSMIILSFMIASSKFNWIILSIFGLAWASPFILLGYLGISVCWLLAVMAFIFSIWINSRALVWYDDVSRTDDDTNEW